jgi:hypothetical protein
MVTKDYRKGVYEWGGSTFATAPNEGGGFKGSGKISRLLKAWRLNRWVDRLKNAAVEVVVSDIGI